MSDFEKWLKESKLPDAPTWEEIYEAGRKAGLEEAAEMLEADQHKSYYAAIAAAIRERMK
jgi:hypothetical protein